MSVGAIASALLSAPRGFHSVRFRRRRLARLGAVGRLDQSLDVDRLAGQRLVAIGALLGAFMLAAAGATAAVGPMLLLVVLAMGAALFLEQRLTVRDRDLIIIGMNFGEGQKTVAVAAVVDEGGLKRGLHPSDLRKIDIAA